ncbi:MAG: PEGA domain-containing protein, partial [Spirochaetaceae bacterium]|nr:PEGA domain-containing protein [Spirochaetaceae bacterium]
MFNRPCPVFATGLFFLLILLPIVISAESFPTPGSKTESSLLGVPTRIDSEAAALGKMKITIDGPRRSLKLTLGTGDWDIRWFRVSPGTYRIDTGVEEAVIEVPPGVIMVSAFRIVLGIAGGEPVIRFEAVDEEDRQKAALKLARYVDFPEWRDREYLGFGSLRPGVEQEQTLFEAVLESNPPGAEIYIDDRLAGTSPLTLNLEVGKHKLLFRADDQEDLTRYVRMNGDVLIQVALSPAADSFSRHETYRTLIGPFYSEGEADEQINTLFVDTLEIALEDDPRLTLIRSDIPWNKLGHLAQRDFSILEETGADLVVTGTFKKEGNQLMVQANLYDIQAESVKTGSFWVGDVGISIFDAMDVIAERFMEEVDRVLPPAGRVLITRSEVVYGALSDKEQGVSRKQIINQRWKMYPDSLNIQTGISVLMGDSVQPASSAQIPIVLDWSKDITPLFQAG